MHNSHNCSHFFIPFQNIRSFIMNHEAKEAGGFSRCVMPVMKKIKWRVGNAFRDSPKMSFSHIGEDLFLRHIVKNFAIGKRISWLDIGASYPVVGNNFFCFQSEIITERQDKIRHKNCYRPSPKISLALQTPSTSYEIH